MTLTDEIKAYALDIGYNKVGITSADDFSDHIQEVRSRQHIYDFYTQDPRQFMQGAQPRGVFPEAKSIISLVWDYAQKAFPESLVGKIGRIYQARCYGPPAHRINGARYALMQQFLEQQGCKIGRSFFIPERRAAARAGTITFGKNNFAYAKGSGSFIVLHSIVVDKILDDDNPTMEVTCPENCTACMDACPTGAIYEPLKLNPRRCLAFNNWWTQDGRPPDVTSLIPYEIRDKMGTRVHGCDVCQEVCPKNQARLKAQLPEDPFLVQIAKRFSLEKMLQMTDEFYHANVMPLMYNYIKEKKYFQRNAAIALGNLGDPESIPALVNAMADPEALVRGSAAWAMGKVGGAKAGNALSRAMTSKDTPAVEKEIIHALAMC